MNGPDGVCIPNQVSVPGETGRNKAPVMDGRSTPWCIHHEGLSIAGSRCGPTGRGLALQTEPPPALQAGWQELDTGGSLCIHTPGPGATLHGNEPGSQRCSNLDLRAHFLSGGETGGH